MYHGEKTYIEKSHAVLFSGIIYIYYFFLQMERTNDALDWIIEALRSGGNVGVKVAAPKLKEIKGKEGSTWNFNL